MTTTNESSLVPEGKAAPAFHLADQTGTKHRLSAYKGQWVVVFFYPKDNTPGCTKEACGFRDAEAQLQDLGAVVLGISPDAVKSKEKFASKFDLNFPILADEEKATCEKYGVWQEKKNYGRTYMGVIRTTYLIDPTGKVAKRWDKVRVAGHVDAVLQTLAELQG